MSKIHTFLAIVVCLSAVNVECFYKSEFVPDYEKALELSLLFYESQRSGKLPSDNRIKWRGDSALEDKGLNGEDLTGGYYDGSDFVKFGFTMAFSTTLLSWGVIKHRNAYEITGQYNEVLEAIKWSTDYFIKCHVSKNEFYGQIGNFSLDHNFWGRPEEMNMTRPAYKIDEQNPGSDLASEASALFSSASIVFRTVNASYSKELLRHAVELYNFANAYKGLYRDVIPGAKQYYECTSYGDELTWAAIWLYKATEDSNYLEDAEIFYKKYNISSQEPSSFFYNNKVAAIQLLLAEVTGYSTYLNSVKKFCDNAIDKELRTPKGLVFIDKFGTLSHAANIAFICLEARNLFIHSAEKYLKFSQEQIHYILGAKGRSFVIGYGYNFPKRPYHPASSCPDKPEPCNWKQYYSPLPNPQILYGAVVSGPDQNDKYEDKREDYLYNEVTVDYNAGFQGALAALIDAKREVRASTYVR